ncbi:hypothetical protein BV22DRAFT_1132472 [Leucogyrophana mollusca]|uniref:Uncharacterized protein n=1 Tax=Leucogyrophana mollusca TaxID=85980 RepID=A0ACB8B5Z3_9AGAM|nr:hypothetical protein BV22DRAFT_1132472 [Leucogyrophana mollusca]
MESTTTKATATLPSWDLSPSLPVPLDILFDIIVHLPLKSVLILRQTSKSFLAVTQLRSLWALLLRIHVLRKNLPIPNLPDQPLSNFSAAELESATCRAISLRRNWASPAPKATRHINIIKGAEPDSRIIFLQFLPGRENRWLISVTMTARPRKFVVQCWDVAIEVPRCVAKLTHIDGPYGGVVINSDPLSPAMLVMQFAHTETFTIDFEEEDPESAFVTHHVIDGIREIHLLSSSTLVTRTPEGEICIWDLDETPEQERLRVVNPGVPPTEKCLAMHKYDNYLIVFRAQTIETYSLTYIPRTNSPPIRGSPFQYPLTRHRWQWRADSVVISEEHQYNPARKRSPPVINIFIRFGSIYPWPVNILHHFSLVANPVCTSSPAPVSPFRTEPKAVQTIASPVRLFSQSTVVLGRYGTALYLDSHTEDWFGPSDRGQRLAGKMLGSADDIGDDATENQGTNGEGGGSKRRRGEMVLGVQEDDLWNRIAVDEESGRVALGCVNGDIEMFEYS